MALWSTIVTTLREVISKMLGARTIEQKLHVTPLISTQMEQAIKEWSDMYKNQASWLREPTWGSPVRVVSLGLPAMIASEKARTALLEFESEITPKMEEVEVPNPDYREPEPDVFGNIMPSIQPPVKKEEHPVGPTERAEYLNDAYSRLKEQLRTQIEYGIAKGGLVIKPYIVFNNIGPDENGNEVTATIEFDFIQADSFYPIAFDASGKITQAAFLQSKAEGDVIYRRLEYHKWENNKLTVINKAFKSTAAQNQGDMSGVDLGSEIPLSDIPEWKDLQENTTINDVSKPLFAYFKVPEANTIDTSSPLGVSGFSRAVQLIKDADMQYSRLLWEYEGGELAIDIDRNAMRLQEDGKGQEHTVPNQLQQRLFRKVDLGEDNTYEVYNPTLRDASFLTGLNTILMRIEDVTGLSRGTLSDPASEARTATELKQLKQRSYQTNDDIQKAIERCLRDTIYIMNAYCDLYDLAPEGEYDVNFEWDDSILVDVEQELGKRITLMQNGLASKLETRMWYFGESETQAAEALLKIDEEAQSAMEDELVMQGNLNKQEGGER